MLRLAYLLPSRRKDPNPPRPPLPPVPELLQIHKALADETRLRLMRLLARGPLNVNEILGILRMGQSRVSRHLRILSRRAW